MLFHALEPAAKGMLGIACGKPQVPMHDVLANTKQSAYRPVWIITDAVSAKTLQFTVRDPINGMDPPPR